MNREEVSEHNSASIDSDSHSEIEPSAFMND